MKPNLFVPLETRVYPLLEGIIKMHFLGGKYMPLGCLLLLFIMTCCNTKIFASTYLNLRVVQYDGCCCFQTIKIQLCKNCAAEIL